MAFGTITGQNPLASAVHYDPSNTEGLITGQNVQDAIDQVVAGRKDYGLFGIQNIYLDNNVTQNTISQKIAVNSITLPSNLIGCIYSFTGTVESYDINVGTSGYTTYRTTGGNIVMFTTTTSTSERTANVSFSYISFYRWKINQTVTSLYEITDEELMPDSLSSADTITEFGLTVNIRAVRLNIVSGTYRMDLLYLNV